jgi:replicative DNA helicase
VEEGRLESWAAGELWSSSEVREYLRDPKGGNPRDGSSGLWPSVPLLSNAKEKLRELEARLLVVPRSAWTVDQIAAHARELHRERRVGAVLVDYIQRLSPPEGSFDRRDLEVSAVSRGLKALSVELAVPVVAGAQINREAVKDGKDVPAGKSYEDEKVQEALKSRRPKLHQLREGGLEQEADLVLGLLNYRADFQTDAEGEDNGTLRDPLPAATRFDVGTLKNRYGDVGRWARLDFEGRFHLLYDSKQEERARTDYEAEKTLRLKQEAHAGRAKRGGA